MFLMANRMSIDGRFLYSRATDGDQAWIILPFDHLEKTPQRISEVLDRNLLRFEFLERIWQINTSQVSTTVTHFSLDREIVRDAIRCK